MNSPLYDMGGVPEWFGPIPVETNEPVFHHEWEARVCGCLIMANGMLGVSEEAFRWAGERLPRAQYLASYYQRWLAIIEQLAIDHGVLAPGELDAQLAGKQPTVSGQKRPGPLRRAAARQFVRTLVGPPPQWLMRLYPRLQDIRLPQLAKPRFAIGDHVTVSAAPTAPAVIHTRRPSYTWGKRGTVVAYYYATVLPERSASGERGPDEHFYTVEFDGRDLWGDDAEPGTAVRIDLFESYLEATS